MLSKSAEYAIRAVLFIAQKGSVQQKLSLQEISQAIDSPPPYTAKMLQKLTAPKGIVRSVRGPHGGFYMTEKAKLLPLSAVLKSIGEYEWVHTCILGLTACSETKPCPLHSEYKKIKPKIISLFEQKSIAALAKALEKDKFRLAL